MVINFNSVSIALSNDEGSAGATKNYGHGLFSVACRMAHSCRPNCVWFSSRDGQSKIVRAIQPIKAGELLTITYIDHHLMERPMFERRLAIKKNQELYLHVRKVQHISGEGRRRFKCYYAKNKQKRCNGFHLVKQACADDEPTLLPCEICGNAAPGHFQELMLEQERDTQAKIDYVDRVTDAGVPVDVTNTIKTLQPPHPRHAMTLQIFTAKAELWNQLEEPDRPVEAQRQWVNCRLRLYGGDYFDEQMGFAYERLGDFLMKTTDKKATRKAYQNAVRALQISRGGSCEPYTKRAMRQIDCSRTEHCFGSRVVSN